MAANFAYVGSGLINQTNESRTDITSPSLNVPSGGIIFAGFRWEGTINDTATISSLTDTASNTWVLAGYSNLTTGSETEKVALFYCINPTGSATLVISATISASRAYTGGGFVWYSNDGSIELISGSVVTGSNTSNVSTWTASSAITATTDDLLVAVVGNYNSGNDISTVTNGTLRVTDIGPPGLLMGMGEVFPGADGDVTLSGNLTGADTFVMVGVGFQAVGGSTANPMYYLNKLKQAKGDL